MPIVRLPQGELRDEIRQPIYDTIDITPATTYPFVQEFYSAVASKSVNKTNLKQNKLLETAVSFRIQGLCLDAQNWRLVNQFVVPILLERSALELQVGEKVYWTGTGRFAAGRVWQDSALDAQAAPASVLLQQYGFSAVQPVILMGRHVIDINPLQSFFVRWSTSDFVSAAEITAATPAAATNVSFVFSLKGLLRRPVQ